MDRKTPPLVATFLLTSAAFLAGCSEESREPRSETAALTSEELVRKVRADNAAKASSDATGVPRGEIDTTVMDRPMDGSSTESFEQGLAQVRSTAPDGQAQRLDSALQYLVAYDLSLKGDRARLYAKLDGKTPNEIIAQARQR